MKEGGRSVYRIAVLAEQEAERKRYAEQITRFCEAKGLFPQVMQYDDQERFFETAQKDAPTNAVIALSGVAGLNAAEHLRSLCPVCRMIWCSDLDFSLHAFRLRADYFLLSVVTVPSDLTKMTANLKAPIVINMNTKKACQLIVNNDNYEVRYNVYDYIQKMKEEK